MRGLMHQAKLDPDQLADPPIDHPFQFSNRKKLSVAIALNTKEGQQLAHQLIATADVVLTNLLPQRRARMRLTTDEIVAINPTAVVGVLTGFGDSGPDAELPGYDLTAFFARSGLSASVGGYDGRPPRWRAAQGDHVAGLSLYAAVMTALVQRATTGKGAVVETSLLAAATWSNAFDLTRAAADGRPSRAKERAGTANVTSEAFRCADGKFVQLSLAEPVSGWRIMCDVLGLGELEHDERYASTSQRFARMNELIELFDNEIAKHDSDELVRAITERGGVAAVVMQSHEVVADPQALACGVLREVEVNGESIDVVNVPFALGEANAGDVAAGIGAPGADSDRVLAEVLGIDSSAIDSLVESGVVGRSSPSV